jgi:hypothetical protein
MCEFPRSPWTSRETNAAFKALDLAIVVLVYNPRMSTTHGRITYITTSSLT